MLCSCNLYTFLSNYCQHIIFRWHNHNHKPLSCLSGGWSIFCHCHHTDDGVHFLKFRFVGACVSILVVARYIEAWEHSCLPQAMQVWTRYHWTRTVIFSMTVMNFQCLTDGAVFLENGKKTKNEDRCKEKEKKHETSTIRAATEIDLHPVSLYLKQWLICCTYNSILSLSCTEAVFCVSTSSWYLHCVLNN